MTATRAGSDVLLSRNALEDALRHACRVRSLYNGETPLDDYGRRIVGEVLRMVLEFPAAHVDVALRPLTGRQASAMRYLAEHIWRDGCAPTYKRMATDLGLKSEASTFELVGVLQSKGYVRRIPKAPRGITLTPAGVDWFCSLTPHPVPNATQNV